MKYTTNYNLKKPEGSDLIDIEDLNHNFGILDEELAKKVDSSKVLTDVPENAKFTDTITEVVNSLTETTTGKALDATQGKILDSKITERTTGNIFKSVAEINAKYGTSLTYESNINQIAYSLKSGDSLNGVEVYGENYPFSDGGYSYDLFSTPKLGNFIVWATCSEVNEPLISFGSEDGMTGWKKIVINHSNNLGTVSIGNATSSSNNSVSIGNGAITTSTNGIAMGAYAKSQNLGAIAIGEVTSNGIKSIALGSEVTAMANRTITIGDSANCDINSENSIAIGNASSTKTERSIAIGMGSSVSTNSPRSISIGYNSKSYASDSISIGSDVIAEASNSIAIGSNAKSGGPYNPGTISIGSNSKAIGQYAVAIGYGSQALYEECVVIGPKSSTQSGGVVIGHNSHMYAEYPICIGDYIKDGGKWDTQSYSPIVIGHNANVGENLKDSIIIGRGLSSTEDFQGILGSSRHKWIVHGNFSVTGTKNFEIPHPKPEKNSTHVIRHGAVESPTAGDTLYRYKVMSTKENDVQIINLPDYFVHLNKDVQVFVTPQGHFGNGFGVLDIESEQLKIHCQYEGEYNVLVIGTRNDDHLSVREWDIKGVEREIGEDWNGESILIELDEIMELDEIKEVR